MIESVKLRGMSFDINPADMRSKKVGTKLGCFPRCRSELNATGSGLEIGT